uniref:Resolvase n=1 Tax=Candidatus Methanomethylicus mesodigestus TaxID=1867258 RepID=A0A7C3F4H3_9CREN
MVDDPVHVARIRKSRGQNFERDLVKRYREAGWWSYRTGGNSAYLPDVMATNDQTGELDIVEAKAGAKDHLYVDWDQIRRDIFLLNGFKRYPSRRLILAFKFLSKKRSGNSKEYVRRELKEYYKLVPEEKWKSLEGQSVCCHYDRGTPGLPDYVPPFKLNRKLNK